MEVLAYLVGGTAPLLGIGVLGLFGAPQLLGPSTRLERLTIDIVDVGLGLALLLLAARLVVRRRRQSRGPGSEPTPTSSDQEAAR